jgi:CRP-like cAMP-binding protein
MSKYNTDPERQDSAFYTYGDNAVVWEEEGKPFYVICSGEMRIHAVTEDGHTEVIRYTNRLEEFGIKTDAQLAEWTDKGEEVFSWVNNSWFEVLHEDDGEFFSEPYHTLDDAIGYAEIANANPEEHLN